MNVKAYMHDTNKLIHHFTHVPSSWISIICWISLKWFWKMDIYNFMSMQYSIFLESTFLFIYGFWKLKNHIWPQLFFSALNFYWQHSIERHIYHRVIFNFYIHCIMWNKIKAATRDYFYILFCTSIKKKCYL